MQFTKALWPAISACSLMAIAVLTVKAGLPSELPVWIQLVVEVLVGAATYVSTLMTAYRERLMTFWRLVVPGRSEHTYAWVPPAELVVVPEELRREPVSEVTPQG